LFRRRIAWPRDKAGLTDRRIEMFFSDHPTTTRAAFRCLLIVMAFTAIGPGSLEARADDGFEGPSFRPGMWHFVRIVELVLNENNKHRVLQREMTRCVDPTHAMKAIFSSPSVGNCVSAKPTKVDVSTVITVDSEEAYTEIDALNVGELPKVELVVARRVGECQDLAPKLEGSFVRAHKAGTPSAGSNDDRQAAF
jgi:hypothetical protein